MSAGGELETLATSEGGHLILAVFVSFAIYQVRSLVTKVLQLQERITEVNLRVDQLEAGRLDPLGERVTALAERIDRLHPPAN